MEPFSMIHQDEFHQRQETGEHSVWELNDDGVLDPTKAVTIYRRSAAGTASHRRSTAQLQRTVSYLIETVLVEQDRVGWKQTVRFVDNRLRAVQKEFVSVTNAASRKLQVQILRAHLLIQYLNVDVDWYEQKFVSTATVTALSKFWEASHDTLRKPAFRENEDEVASYTLLLDLRDATLKNDSRASLSFGLRKLQRMHASFDGPCLSWTLRLLTTIFRGEYVSVLHQLLQQHQHADDHGLPFLVLSKCILAPCIPKWHYKAMQVYNTAFAKSHAISIEELSHMLWSGVGKKDGTTMVDHNTTIRQLAVSAGLPVHSDSDDTMMTTSVIFHQTAMEPYQPPTPLRPYCDAWVFPPNKIRHYQLSNSGGVAVPSRDFMRALFAIDD